MRVRSRPPPFPAGSSSPDSDPRACLPFLFLTPSVPLIFSISCGGRCGAKASAMIGVQQPLRNAGLVSGPVLSDEGAKLWSW